MRGRGCIVSTEELVEICVCSVCGAALMLDDKQGRIRVAVPNIMGYDDSTFPQATYHAFWDETKGERCPLCAVQAASASCHAL